MEWERERPSSFARALFISNAFHRGMSSIVNMPLPP